MTVMMIRATVRTESVPEVEAGAREVFSAIAEAQPTGVRYASRKLPDGVTFVAILEIDDGIDNPLPTVLAFRKFQENLKNWIAEPPTPEPLEVIGTYRLF